MVLHKDSRWFMQWRDFKNSNPLMQRLFGVRTLLQNSDHVLARGSRAVTDAVHSILGSVLNPSETAQTLTAIAQVDPTFNKERFMLLCERTIIPTILEAYLSGDLPTLKDWCHEPAYNMLAAIIQQWRQAHLTMEYRILDLRNVDIPVAKMMEHGPVLILTFTAQQVTTLRDAAGTIVDGNPNKIQSVHYIVAMCRDQSVYNPTTAWRVLELHVQQAENTW